MPWLIEETKPLSRPPALPQKQAQIGNTVAEWFESEPGVAVILCTGGTIDDRWLAECVTRETLAACGIRQAKFTFDQSPEFRKTAEWNDIMAKAKRLIQSGNVTLLRNGYNNVVAHVVGDHGEYQTEISRDDPNSRVITQWTCECPWDQFAFQRTRKWKKYEARPCAHVLAAYWKSLGTPLDEQLDESQIENMGTGQKLPGGPGIQGQPPGSTFGPSDAPIEHGYQPSLPVQGQPGDGWSGQMPGAPPMMPGMVPNPTTMAPSQLPPMMAPPGDNQVIPPYPMDPAQLQMPVSVPGGRPGPYPADPIQQPGTLSHVAARQFMYHLTSPQNRESILKNGLLIKHDEGHKTPDLGEFGHGVGGTRPGVYLSGKPQPHCTQDMWRVNISGLNPLPDPWGTNMAIYKDKPYFSEWGGSFYLPHDVEPQRLQLVRQATRGCKNPRCEDCDGEGSDAFPTLSHVIHVAAETQFIQGMAARINEATLGQSEGREGAYDAGQWMEIPRNARVEVVHQDPTTGWVEVLYPLKGGPMSSYHIRCFVEPEKLTPLPGQGSPFQNPKR